MRKDPSKTLTTGMTDAWLFDQDFAKPKQLAKVGGQLANDYGLIPKLREPYKPNRKYQFRQRRSGRMRNLAKTMIANTYNTNSGI